MKCPDCEGNGKIVLYFKPYYGSRYYPDLDSEVESTCTICKGKGEIFKWLYVLRKLKYELIKIRRKIE